MMTEQEAIAKHNDIQRRLTEALSTMDKKDTLFEINKEIFEFQKVCPHSKKLTINKHCLWCDKDMLE